MKTIDELIQRKGNPVFQFIFEGEDVKKFCEEQYLDDIDTISFVGWINERNGSIYIYAKIGESKLYHPWEAQGFLILKLFEFWQLSAAKNGKITKAH